MLVLSFAEPVTLERDKLASELPSYVAMVRLDPDGKGLRLALSRPVRLNVMEAGERLFVDLLPAKYSGVTPGLPQDVVDELAQRARTAEAALKEEKNTPPKPEIKPVTFRIGTLPTLTRLVLTPPKGVPVSFRQEDDRAIVDFTGPVSIERARLKAALGAAVLSIETSGDEQGLKLVLNVAADTKLQGFAEDDAFVVDIAKVSDKKNAARAPPRPMCCRNSPSSIKRAEPKRPPRVRAVPTELPRRRTATGRRRRIRPALAAHPTRASPAARRGLLRSAPSSRKPSRSARA